MIRFSGTCESGLILELDRPQTTLWTDICHWMLLISAQFCGSFWRFRKLSFHWYASICWTTDLRREKRKRWIDVNKRHQFLCDRRISGQVLENVEPKSFPLVFWSQFIFVQFYQMCAMRRPHSVFQPEYACNPGSLPLLIETFLARFSLNFSPPTSFFTLRLAD